MFHFTLFVFIFTPNYSARGGNRSFNAFDNANGKHSKLLIPIVMINEEFVEEIIEEDEGILTQ